MIFLTKLANPRMAQAYIDYMATKGMLIEPRPVGHNEAELWLQEQNRLEEARQELQLFLQEPDHPRYRSASWQLSRANLPIRYPTFSYWQVIREGGGWVTHTVALLCIFIYLLMLLTGGESLFSLLSFPDSEDQMLALWRWLTPALIHFSWQHILFNLVFWWYLAGRVEKVLGSRQLLLLTLLAAFVSSCAQYLFSGPNFGGLSGVVYALIGYVWLYGERRKTSPLQLPRALIAVIVIWFVIDYFDLLGPIGNAAHFSGLVLGLVLAWWDTRGREQGSG